MPIVQDIIISISRGTTGLKQMVFRPLIVGSGTEIPVAVCAELSELVTAGYGTSDAEYKMAAAMFAQTPRPTNVAVYRKPTATAWDAALAALVLTYNDFWGVVITSRTEADLYTAGTWCNTNRKFFVGCVNDVTSGSGRNADREAFMIHDVPTDYPDAAWMGRCIPTTPGSITWKWKQLSGQVAAGFSATDMATIRTNNTQALQEQAGVIFTNEGITTSGEYIDVIMGQDWVQDQLETELLGMFVRNGKVSLDDAGIAQVESVVRGVLKRAGDNGLIARSISDADKLKSDDKIFMFQVTVPLRSELSANDLATRHLNSVGFVYYLAGAIHKLTVSGLITV